MFNRNAQCLLISAMDPIVIDDVAVLKCPICLDVFDKPKLLFCGHTLCAACIEQLHNSSLELDVPLACPECRRNVDVPSSGVENLASNFVIQRVLDARRFGTNNNATDSWAQADSDIDGLKRFVFRLKQKERCLKESCTKVMDALRREKVTILRKGDEVKQVSAHFASTTFRLQDV